MIKYPFPALEVNPLTGDEPFIDSAGPCAFDLLDFWRWMGSDLVSNATRGVLAEYIVAKALACEAGVRTEWDAYDLRTSDGIAIEVKSAAYCQSWGQHEFSKIGFDIAPKRQDNIPGNETNITPRRPADVYVFCVLHHKEQNTINPLDLAQWEFYVLSTHVLDSQRPTQKSIALSPLRKLGAHLSDFAGLREAVTIAVRGRE